MLIYEKEMQGSSRWLAVFVWPHGIRPAISRDFPSQKPLAVTTGYPDLRSSLFTAVEVVHVCLFFLRFPWYTVRTEVALCVWPFFSCVCLFSSSTKFLLIFSIAPLYACPVYWPGSGDLHVLSRLFQSWSPLISLEKWTSLLWEKRVRSCGIFLLRCVLHQELCVKYLTKISSHHQPLRLILWMN